MSYVRLALAAAPLLAATPAFAQKVAQQPSISGNIWVPIAIIVVLVGVVALLVWASFGLEKRDAKLKRGGDDDSHIGGLGLF